MSAYEKRLEAAQMLGIVPTATPAEANAAYTRRLKQFLDFDNGNHNLRFQKNINLYNAHAIMRRPENKQWIAQTELALTSEATKTFEIILATLQVIKNNSDGPIYHALLDELSRLIQKLYSQYRILRASRTYILGMLIGKMVYDGVHPISEQSMWLGLGVYGSMMIATFVMGFTMGAMDKKKQQIDAMFEIMKHCRGL